MKHLDQTVPFITKVLENGIATLKATDENEEASIGFITQALRYVSQMEALLAQDNVKALMYYSLFPNVSMRFKDLFKEEKDTVDYEETLYALLIKVEQLKKQPKPVIAYSNHFTSGIDLAVNLWAHYTIVNEDAELSFPEFKYGLLPPLGAIRHTFSRMSFKDAYAFLTESNCLTAAEAVANGLITQTVPEGIDPILIVEKLVREHKPIKKEKSFNQQDWDFLNTMADKSRKKNRGLIPAANVFLEMVTAILKTNSLDLLRQEAQLYHMVMANKKTEAMVRTGYYFKVDKRRKGVAPAYEPNRIGVIGAGMMGAGISFEAAKAGKTVYLKDATLEQAVLGKEHVADICERLVNRGQMSKAKMESLLEHIHPVAKYTDLDALDAIIEAVFENMELKKNVIEASFPSLSHPAIFATNTTSLLISDLAKATDNPKDFVGMHFFSPVDRMNVVEIIRGRQTSSQTIERTMKLANQLGKTVLIVNDSPAFYTSRVFFNYLLEAITLLLEGVPPILIEEEAQKAGFAVGPLEVLDEISLPLMAHVYDQLPELNPSQKRAYNYLKSLIDLGRSGRKSNRGFYNYDVTGKVIWQDPTIPLMPAATAFDQNTIAKRLLHVMALDSYRCLDEGVLEDPSDADIGSTLGIGFPKHTGGVFSYMEQVGLAPFVKECEMFATKGQQWDMPASLRKLASENYTFYKDMKSNWK